MPSRDAELTSAGQYPIIARELNSGLYGRRKNGLNSKIVVQYDVQMPESSSVSKISLYFVSQLDSTEEKVIYTLFLVSKELNLKSTGDLGTNFEILKKAISFETTVSPLVRNGNLVLDGVVQGPAMVGRWTSDQCTVFAAIGTMYLDAFGSRLKIITQPSIVYVSPDWWNYYVEGCQFLDAQESTERQQDMKSQIKKGF